MIKYWLCSLLLTFSFLHAGLPTGSLHLSVPNGNGVDSVFVLLEHVSGRFKAGASLSIQGPNNVLLPVGGWIVKQCVVHQTLANSEQALNCSLNGIFIQENITLSVDVKLASLDTIVPPMVNGCSAGTIRLLDKISGSDGWSASSSWLLSANLTALVIPSSQNNQVFIHNWEVQCGSDAFMKVGPVEPSRIAGRSIAFVASSTPAASSKLQMGAPPWTSGSCDGFQGFSQMDSSLLTMQSLSDWGVQVLGEPMRWIPDGNCAQGSVAQSRFRVWDYSGIPSLPDLGDDQIFTTPSPITGLAQKNVRRSVLAHKGLSGDGAFWSSGDMQATVPFQTTSATTLPVRSWFYDLLRWKGLLASDSLVSSWTRRKEILLPDQTDSSGSAYLGVHIDIGDLDSVHDVHFSGNVERLGKVLDSMEVRLDGKGVLPPFVLPMYLPAGLAQGWIHLKREGGWLALRLASQNLQDGDSLQIDIGMTDQWNWSKPTAESCMDPKDPLSVAVLFQSMEPIDSMSIVLNGNALSSLPALGAYQMNMSTNTPLNISEGRYPILARAKMRSGRESSLGRWISLDATQPSIQWTSPQSVVLVSPDSVWKFTGSVSDAGSGIRSAFFKDQPARIFDGTIVDSLIVSSLSGFRIFTAEDKCGFIYQDTLNFTVQDKAPVAHLGSCNTIRALVYAGGELQLDAGLSSDADDFIKSYSWFFDGQNIGNRSSVSWLPDSSKGDLALQVMDRYGLIDTAMCFIDSTRLGFRGVCGTASPDTCGVCEDQSSAGCTDLSRRFASGPEWSQVQFSSVGSILSIRLETCNLTAFEDDQILYLNTDTDPLTGFQGMEFMLVWDYFRPGSTDSVRVLLSKWDGTNKRWETPTVMANSVFTQTIANGPASLVAEIILPSAITKLKWSLEGGRYQLGSRFLPKLANGINTCAGGSCGD